MYAIVREGNGKYYMSTVFGYYNNSVSTWDYSHEYWVVLNREKTALVNQQCWADGSHGIAAAVLAVDSNQHDWVLEDKNAQSMAFLPTNQLYNMIATGTVPREILQKCIDLDNTYAYDPYPTIQTEKDIEDFYLVSGGLHDFYISQVKQVGDSLYVLFKGEWGCDIELCFSGEISYDVTAQESAENIREWPDSTLILQNGFVYLIDERDAKVENTWDGHCWFKAKYLKYHVIPE